MNRSHRFIAIILALSLIGTSTEAAEFEVKQITFGPQHHFFGYFGHVRTVPWNASGRFILPDHLAELCAIDQGICFLGGGQFFTLWAPKQLYAMDHAWAGQQALCRKLEADAKGKRK